MPSVPTPLSWSPLYWGLLLFILLMALSRQRVAHVQALASCWMLTPELLYHDIVSHHQIINLQFGLYLPHLTAWGWSKREAALEPSTFRGQMGLKIGSLQWTNHWLDLLRPGVVLNTGPKLVIIVHWSSLNNIGDHSEFLVTWFISKSLPIELCMI